MWRGMSERKAREERAPPTGSRTQLRLQVVVRPAEPLLKGRGTTEVSGWSLPVPHPIHKELRAGGRSQPSLQIHCKGHSPKFLESGLILPFPNPKGHRKEHPGHQTRCC